MPRTGSLRKLHRSVTAAPGPPGVDENCFGVPPIIDLTDPRSKDKVKYKLGAKVIFDWLLNDVKGTYGEANYVMFGMSYDMTQLFCQLPHDVTYEIFKGKRFDDEYEFDAPVFWREYAIKLVQSNWLILWRLKDHNHPYMKDVNGDFILDKKGRKQLEAEVLNWARLSDAVALILRTAE